MRNTKKVKAGTGSGGTPSLVFIGNNLSSNNYTQNGLRPVVIPTRV